MTVRPYLTLALVMGSALALAPAHASPAAACKQLQDPAGDATVSAPAPNTASLDILSGDLATGRKNMVVVLRLASLSAEPSTAAGSLYAVNWKTNGLAQGVSLSIASDGSQDAKFSPDASFGSSVKPLDITATMDKATASITWVIPRKSNPSLKPAAKAARMTELAASARPSFNLRAGGVSFAGTFLSGDSADGGKAYLDKAPSCVKGT